MNEQTNPKYKAFTELDLHVILYAKNWYTITETMSDLRQLISKVFWVDVSTVSDEDIVSLVADTMHRLFSIDPMTMGDHQILYKEVWRDYSTLFAPNKKSITAKDIVDSFIRVIFHKITHDLSIPNPNPKYLPTEKVDRWKEMQARRINTLLTK